MIVTRSPFRIGFGHRRGIECGPGREDDEIDDEGSNLTGQAHKVGHLEK